MRKTKLILVFCLLAFGIIKAQTFPYGINYQAVARDANGNARTNQQVPIQFTIIKSSISGVNVWQERQVLTTNSMGQFNAVIGRGQPVSPFIAGGFSQLDWNLDSMFLKVEINSNISFTGTFSQIGSTSKFQAVPYAMNAAKSDTANVAKFSQWNDYAIYEEQAPAGTAVASVAGWNQRALNATQSSSGNSISRTGSTITLNPGTYYIRASSMGYRCDQTKLCLRDMSNNVVLIGQQTFSNSYTIAWASLEGVLVVSTQTTYKLDQHITTAYAAGLGYGGGGSGLTEIFARIIIQKIK